MKLYRWIADKIQHGPSVTNRWMVMYYLDLYECPYYRRGAYAARGDVRRNLAQLCLVGTARPRTQPQGEQHVERTDAADRWCGSREKRWKGGSGSSSFRAYRVRTEDAIRAIKLRRNSPKIPPAERPQHGKNTRLEKYQRDYRPRSSDEVGFPSQ